MGILTCKQGTEYVIGSDRSATDGPTKRPPKKHVSGSLEVWMRETWLAVMTEAMTFDTLAIADEYVRANFAKITGQLSPAKPNNRRPAKSMSPSPVVTEL